MQLAGVGVLLALDALEHSAVPVRAAAHRWLTMASAAPSHLIEPLLSLLLLPGAAAGGAWLRVYVRT